MTKAEAVFAIFSPILMMADQILRYSGGATQIIDYLSKCRKVLFFFVISQFFVPFFLFVSLFSVCMFLFDFSFAGFLFYFLKFIYQVLVSLFFSSINFSPLVLVYEATFYCEGHFFRLFTITVCFFFLLCDIYIFIFC